MDTDQRTIEVEPVDTADALAKSFRAVIDEGVKLADSLGKAVVTAAQDLSNIMIIKVDSETRSRLDALVEAGVAASRCKAATALLHEGLKAQQPLIDRIEKTKSQISGLRQELRSLLNTAA